MALDLDASNVANWVDLDLYETFNLQRAEESLLHAYEVGTFRGNLLEWLRNIAVLGPILLTWFALSKASAAYAALLASSAHRADRNLPFLLLWERRFDGMMPWWLAFSSVALLDAGLVLVIILLTALSHARSSFLQSAATERAINARRQLENVIWMADLALQPYRASNSRTLAQALDRSLQTAVASITALIQPAVTDVTTLIKQASNRFQTESDRLVALLEAQERRLDALAAQRQTDVDVLAQFVQPFTTGAQSLQSAATAMQQAIAQVQPTMQDIKNNTAQLQQLAVSQHQLAAAMSSTMGKVVDHERIMAQELQSTAQVLSDTVDRNQDVAADLVTQAADTANLVQQVTQIANDLQASQAAIANDLKQAQSGLGLVLRDAVQENRQMTQSAAAMATAAANMATAAGRTSTDFTDATAALQAVHAQIVSLGAQLQPLTTSLPQNIQELGDLVDACQGMLVQMQSTLQQLGGATGQVAQALFNLATNATSAPPRHAWWRFWRRGQP